MKTKATPNTKDETMSTKKSPTARQVEDALFHGHTEVTKSIGGSKGRKIFTAKRGFLYQHSRTSQNIIKDILSTFPEASIIDFGVIWGIFDPKRIIRNRILGRRPLPFRGHCFVTFTL